MKTFLIGVGIIIGLYFLIKALIFDVKRNRKK
jgi:hypothetical protein